MLDAAPTKETLLEVNNIEVIYNHVILVKSIRHKYSHSFRCAVKLAARL